MITIRIAERYGILMLHVVLVLSAATCLQAQTPTPTPKSEEVQKLEEQKAQLDLRKAIAEDEKAIRDAKFPNASTTPLAGTTTLNEGAVIEGQIIAHVAMARAANKLVSALSYKPGSITNLAIFNEADVKLLLSYKVAQKQLEMIRQAYARLLMDSVINGCRGQISTEVNLAELNLADFTPGGLQIAKSALGSFVDLTALLRTNVDIKGQSFDIGEAPLVAEVFRAARCRWDKNTTLYYPAMFPPDVDSTKEYEILKNLDELRCLRISAGKLVADLEKNQKDIDESDAKVKTIDATMKQTDAAKKDAESELRRVLRAHCKNASENDRILDEQLSKYGLSGWLRRFCPKLPADQRERLFVLRDKIASLASDYAKLEIKIQTEKANLETLKGKQKEFWKNLQGNINNKGAADDAAAQLKGLNEQFDKLIASFIQAETATGINQLTMFIKAENLKTALPPGTSFWLQLKVLKAGGNNRIKTNLLWDIFTGGNRVSHSGGLIVEYILFDTTGKSVASDTITEYTNYIKAGKIKDLPSEEVDDTGCPCSYEPKNCPAKEKQ